jgi:hypothetical protein
VALDRPWLGGDGRSLSHAKVVGAWLDGGSLGSPRRWSQDELASTSAA